MSFFDKFKAGVSDAGNKAKTLVEINRLKLQNNGKKATSMNSFWKSARLYLLQPKLGSGRLIRRVFKATWTRFIN